jgi:hypothetical protein
MWRHGAILTFENDRSIVELIIQILGDEGCVVRYVHLPRNESQLLDTVKPLEQLATTHRLGFTCRFG